MYAIRNAKKGFTLVEILIVVIILGILAAIVIPQFTNASEDARKSSLTSQLQTIRSQVELYKLQHRDEFPTSDGTYNGTWDWSKMTTKTDEEGVPFTNPATQTGPFGPYLQAAPKNPLSGSSEMDNSPGTDLVGGAAYTAVTAGGGWTVTANGKIYALSKTGAFVYNEAKASDTNNAK